MNRIYKSASRAKLRIATPKGTLSVEQLWDLSLTDLDKVAVELDASRRTESKSFLKENPTPQDRETELSFNIVLDILETKQADQERARKAQETKAKKQQIMELIKNKENEALADKSIEELTALLDDV